LATGAFDRVFFDADAEAPNLMVGTIISCDNFIKYPEYLR